MGRHSNWDNQKTGGWVLWPTNGGKKGVLGYNDPDDDGLLILIDEAPLTAKQLRRLAKKLTKFADKIDKDKPA